MRIGEKLCGVGLTGILLLWGCAETPRPPIAENRPVSFVDRQGGQESARRDTVNNPFPYMRMAYGQMTLNDRCPVRQGPLNLRLPAVYVNGRPVGFC